MLWVTLSRVNTSDFSMLHRSVLPVSMFVFMLAEQSVSVPFMCSEFALVLVAFMIDRSLTSMEEQSPLAVPCFTFCCHVIDFFPCLSNRVTDLLRHCRAAVMFSLCTVQELQVVTVVHQKVFGTSQDWAIDNNALHDFTSMVLILSMFDMR